MNRFPTNNAPIIDRLMFHVEKTEQCWLFKGTLDPCGYGKITTGANRARGAHRVAYESLVGQIPKGMHVLHKCDTRNCVNPDHLFLGTHQDNMTDMKDKGRAVGSSCGGERNGMSRLTERDVITIHDMWAMGMRQKKIADAFNIRQQQVSRIVTGRRWGYLMTE